MFSTQEEGLLDDFLLRIRLNQITSVASGLANRAKGNQGACYASHLLVPFLLDCRQ